MQTLLLDTVAWDLVLDANGNIAVASNPYSLAQDSASMIQTFQGEVFYDTTVGIPYFKSVFGKSPISTPIKSLMVGAALTVPEVANAQCFINSFSQRTLTGQVQIFQTTGQVSASNFTVANTQGTG